MTFCILYENYWVYRDANWIVGIYKKISRCYKKNWISRCGTEAAILFAIQHHVPLSPWMPLREQKGTLIAEQQLLSQHVEASPSVWVEVE